MGLGTGDYLLMAARTENGKKNETLKKKQKPERRGRRQRAEECSLPRACPRLLAPAQSALRPPEAGLGSPISQRSGGSRAQGPALKPVPLPRLASAPSHLSWRPSTWPTGPSQSLHSPTTLPMTPASQPQARQSTLPFPVSPCPDSRASHPRSQAWAGTPYRVTTSSVCPTCVISGFLVFLFCFVLFNPRRHF